MVDTVFSSQFLFVFVVTEEIDYFGITAIDCRGRKMLLAGRMNPSPTSSTDVQNLSLNSPIFDL